MKCRSSCTDSLTTQEDRKNWTFGSRQLMNSPESKKILSILPIEPVYLYVEVYFPIILYSSLTLMSMLNDGIKLASDRSPSDIKIVSKYHFSFHYQQYLYLPM